MFGSSVMNYIIAARTTQGYEDAKNSTKEERLEIITRWREHKDEYQNSKMKLHETGKPEGQDTGHLTPKGFMQTRHLTFDERKKLHEDRKTRREEERRKLEAEQGHSQHKFCPFCRRTAPHTHEPRAVQTQAHVGGVDGSVDVDHFEQAIHESVAATSRGNAEEDMMIERAIRASVRELQSSQGSNLTDEESLNRAIQASISEAARHRSDEQHPGITMTDEEAEHQVLLEQAIQASLAQHQLKTAASPVADDDADHEANLKLAMQMSKEDVNKSEAARLLHEHKEIELALAQSKNEHAKTKTEEDVILEYVQKQSMLEAEHKKSVEGKRTEPAPVEVASVAPPVATPASTIDDYMSPADEEALRRAIEESMDTTHGAASGSRS